MAGQRLGDALDELGLAQASRALALAEEQDNVSFGKTVDPADMARLWEARNEARGCALLGDPAARLPFDAPPSAA